MAQFNPKEEVWYMARNKMHKSKVQMILPRKDYHLYHLENGDNIEIEIMFKSLEELVKNLVTNIKSK